jgi:hypothetical protein
MPNLSITHHERVEGHPHRWHVHLRGRDEPLPVELPEEEREKLELSDEAIHDLIPTAVQRRAHERSRDDDELGLEEYRDASWDAPVRVMQTHFMA